ncbi:uncharacterized protein [Misgurnus anguillicaudatus]|uniref:uncharacterized protein isoform X1 n=1 Tax=Misgurnus anguillicaudatus TaxID=75329 RepID=UPI003CCF8714
MTCMMYVTQIGLLFCLVVTKALGQCKGKCENLQISTISIPLKSEVLLPCNFEISNNTANKTNRASWRHLSSSLLNITQDGNIIFEDPREGRVTVFPILAAGGNFSIIIHNVQASDFGSYCCELNRECLLLQITETTRPEKKFDLNPWIYFAAGAGLFILLFFATYLFAKLWGNVNETSKSNSVNGVQNEGNHTEERQNTERSEHRNPNNRGQGRENTTVYENEAHAPNQNPQRAIRRAPPEPPSEASDPKPYYVNQEELSVSSNAGKKRKKNKPAYQYKNPIYGD